MVRAYFSSMACQSRSSASTFLIPRIPACLGKSKSAKELKCLIALGWDLRQYYVNLV